MSEVEESFEDRLVRLGTETEGIKARADFVMRVMQTVEAEASAAPKEDWSLQVLRWSRLGMAVATMAAAACIALAWDSANSADHEEALAYGMSEVFE